MLTLNLTFSFCSDFVAQEKGSVFCCHLQLNFRFFFFCWVRKKKASVSFSFFLIFCFFCSLFAPGSRDRDPSCNRCERKKAFQGVE